MSIDTVIELFHEILMKYVEDLELQDSHPKAFSPAFTDCANNFDHLDIIQTIHSLSGMYISSSLELGLGVSQSLAQSRTITPLINCRSLLELTALQIWLTNLEESTQERLKRLFSIRYNGFLEQKKIATNSNDIERLNKMIEKVVNQAKLFNINFARDRNNKIIGLGCKFPNSTVIAKKYLDLEKFYRIFSAVVHGQYWALRHSSYKTISNNKKLYLLPSLNDEARFSCIYATLIAINKAIKSHYDYMGFDINPLFIKIKPLQIELSSHMSSKNPLV